MTEKESLKLDKSNSSPVESEKNYFIHDNGGRPYNVFIEGDPSGKCRVSIYKTGYSEGENKDIYTDLAIPLILAEKAFVGESPKNNMTEFSDGYGPRFNGNSILLQISRSKKEYIFIGSKIFSFLSKFEIVDFISPVGNNDVPYPYAIDVEDNYYLMIEDVSLKVPHGNYDPYRYYYDKHTITNGSSVYGRDNNGNRIRIQRELFIKNFDGVTRFYEGDEMYTLCYNPDPKSHYEWRETLENFGEYSVDKIDGNTKAMMNGPGLFIDR